MNPADFRRIALSLPGAEEGSHMGAADFRVGGRIFATLASQAQGYGNLMLEPEQQRTFVDELPEIFLPVHGGWGRMGATHCCLAEVSADVLEGALRTAWKLRLEKNAKSGRKSAAKTPKSSAGAASTLNSDNAAPPLYARPGPPKGSRLSASNSNRTAVTFCRSVFTLILPLFLGAA